jgi:hypothetical protein
MILTIDEMLRVTPGWSPVFAALPFPRETLRSALRRDDLPTLGMPTTIMRVPMMEFDEVVNCLAKRRTDLTSRLSWLEMKMHESGLCQSCMILSCCIHELVLTSNKLIKPYYTLRSLSIPLLPKSLFVYTINRGLPNNVSSKSGFRELSGTL